ncbi:MAG: hypothetical protein AB7N76_19250 [Planctomycetota bacterium]
MDDHARELRDPGRDLAQLAQAVLSGALPRGRVLAAAQLGDPLARRFVEAHAAPRALVFPRGWDHGSYVFASACALDLLREADALYPEQRDAAQLLAREARYWAVTGSEGARERVPAQLPMSVIRVDPRLPGAVARALRSSARACALLASAWAQHYRAREPFELLLEACDLALVPRRHDLGPEADWAVLLAKSRPLVLQRLRRSLGTHLQIGP